MPSTGKREWKLTPAAFDRLLRSLDPDPERAALAYARLRERIAGLAEWWGAREADDIADETLDRVARKLEEGVVVPDQSFGPYVRGVARLVFYEFARKPDELMPAQVVAPIDDESALTCLDHCLETLSKSERDIVLRYYDDGAGGKIEGRRLLAGELGISMTALRIRTHRIREQLERCVSTCLEAR
jgi:DNA-directed RNA polymerase specialized sigma24 family protein